MRRSVAGDVEVHRGEGDVAAATGSGLLAGSLQGQRARGQNTVRCTGGPVVTEHIKHSMARTTAGSERERQAQPAKQQNSELGRRDSDILGGGQDCESPRGVRPGLRKQEYSQ